MSIKKFKNYSFIVLIALAIFSFYGCGRKEIINTGNQVVEDKDTSTTNKSDETKSKEDVLSETVDLSGETETLNDGPIKIMYTAGLCQIPLHIAKDLGFYEAEGLVEGVDYEYVTSSTSGVEMLTTKQADVTFALIAAMLAPLDNGLEAKTVLGVHTGCIQLITGVNSDINQVSDLKGKKIGVQQLASSAHIVAQRALASVDIGSTVDRMDVEFIVFPVDDLPLALENGAVDAIAIGDPKATILNNEGKTKSLFNSASSDLLKDEYCCSIWARNEIIEKYPKTLSRIIAAIQKASAFVEQNTEIVTKIQLEKQWLVGDATLNAQVLSSFNYLPSIPGVEIALTRNILDMKELGLIKKDTDAHELAKSGFFHLDGVADDVTETIIPPIDPNTILK